MVDYRIGGRSGRTFGVTDPVSSFVSDLSSKVKAGYNKAKLGQQNQGGAGSNSLQTPESIAPIINGETNKFDNPAAGSIVGATLGVVGGSVPEVQKTTGSLDTSTADSILEAGKPKFSNPVPYQAPKGDLVSQAVEGYVPANLQHQQEDTNVNQPRIGEGLQYVQNPDGSVSKYQNGIKQEMKGNYVFGEPTPGQTNTSSSPTPTLQNPMANVRAPSVSDTPSQWELDTARRNAEVGSRSIMGGKGDLLKYQELLAKRKAGEDYKNEYAKLAGTLTGEQNKALIGAEAHKYAANQARIGEEQKAAQAAQAAGSKLRYDAMKDAGDLAFKKAELAQKEQGRLGSQALDLGKLNEMYDAKIAEQATQGTPESAAGLQQGRAAALITATGDVEKALKADPTAMAIISGNEAPEVKVEKLKRLHPQYANYFLSQK